MIKPLLVTHRFKDVPLIRTLQELGVNIVLCSSFSEVKKSAPDSMGYFGSLFTELKKPLSLILLLHQLHKIKVPYIFWNRDAPWHCGIKKHRKLILKILKPVDIYLAHSLQNHSWFTKHDPIYFPNGAQRKYITNTLPEESRNSSYYQFDISFIGSIGNTDRLNCRKRKMFLDTIQQIISSYNIEVKFVVIDTYRNSMTAEEQISIIKHSKINLNIGAMCDLPGTPSWGLPERVFGIPATGGFLLTDWRYSIPRTFTESKCDYFQTPNECAEKIIYYLNNFNIIRMRAEKLHDEVINNHTYNNRAVRLLNILTHYHQSQHKATK